MSGVAQYRKTGPRTFSPAAGQSIKGGNGVISAAGGRVAVAGAGALNALGVALNDSIAPEQVVTTPQTGSDGRPVTAMYSLPPLVAVADNGVEVKVTYAANANFGDKLITAANGQVTPAGATPDARTIVGVC